LGAHFKNKKILASLIPEERAGFTGKSKGFQVTAGGERVERFFLKTNREKKWGYEWQKDHIIVSLFCYITKRKTGEPCGGKNA